MSPENPLLERITSRILASAVGPRGLLTLPHLIRLFQEAAMQNTQRLGISTPALMDRHGLTWVLHRQEITATAWPGLGEAVTVITAPIRVNRQLVTIREFRLLDAAGRTLISSLSSWSVMHFDSRRIRPLPDEVLRLLPELPPPTGPAWPGAKIPVPERTDHDRQFQVSFSHLDFNNHLTNPAFGELMIEPLGLDWLTTYLPKRADIAYHREARYGDALIAATSGTDPRSTVRHTLRRDGDLLAIMETEWMPL